MADLLLAKRQRGTVLGKLTRIKTFFDNVSKLTNTWDEINVRYEKLAEIDHEFMELHAAVYDASDEDDKKDQDAKLIEFEELFYAASARASELRKLFAPEIGYADNSIHFDEKVREMNVPPVDVRPFDGGLEDWIRFQEMFKVVYGPQRNMVDLERFYRLRECLRGDALQLVESLTYTNESYQLAWKMLEKRYDDKYLLISLQIHRILNLEQIEESSSELGIMLDTINSVLGTLRSLEQSTDSWDMLIITIVSSKLDEKSREFWEAQIPDQELPTWELMENCLQKRARILTASARQRDVPAKQMNVARFESNKFVNGRQSFHASSSMNCIKCNKTHSLLECVGFLNLTLTQKYDLLKSHRRCFNCLDGAHMNVLCPATESCGKCDRRHHAILHYEYKEADAKIDMSETSS